MIYFFIALITLLPTHMIATSWGSNSAKDLKQPVNFFGKITTHQGQDFTVDNISIYGKCAKIPMAYKPKNLPEPELNNETKKYTVKLTENPNGELSKEDVDLDETKEISVPSPNTIYVYQKKERSQRLEFLEVEITDNSGVKSFYLLESKTPIYCDGINSAGPKETTVPLSALKTLTIDGWRYRDTSSNKKKKCRSNDCPPCEVENQK